MSSETSLPPRERSEVLLHRNPATTAVALMRFEYEYDTIRGQHSRQSAKVCMERAELIVIVHFPFHQNGNFSTLALFLVVPLRYELN